VDALAKTLQLAGKMVTSVKMVVLNGDIMGVYDEQQPIADSIMVIFGDISTK